MNHGISNLDRVIKYEAWTKDTANIQRPVIYTSLGGQVGCIVFDVEPTQIIVYTDSNRSSMYMYCTLYYTKTS